MNVEILYMILLDKGEKHLGENLCAVVLIGKCPIQLSPFYKGSCTYTPFSYSTRFQMHLDSKILHCT